MKSIVLLITIFSTQVMATERVCIVLKKTTKYNHYVQRIESVFKHSLNKNLFKISSYKHDSSLGEIKKISNLVKNDKCKYVFGGISSSDSMKFLKFMEGSGIQFITPTSSSVELKKIHSNTKYMSIDDDYVIYSLFQKIKMVKDDILIVRNLSFPNTKYISTKLYEMLSRVRDDISIVDILKGRDVKLEPKHKKIKNIVIPSYEKDVIKIHNEIKVTVGKKFFGIDGWGTNKSIYKKFIQNDDSMSIVKLDYWDNRTCLKKKFKKICQKFIKLFPEKGFDSFMAVSYDSAIYLNNLFNNKKQDYMTMSKGESGEALKKPHFYMIDNNGVKYINNAE